MASIQVEPGAGRMARKAIRDGLVAHNASRQVPIKRKPLVVTLREGGAVVGGLAGDTYLEWLHVQLFWISEAFRGQDYGRKLLDAAEAAASKRGARNVWLETYDFQAPEFYRKLGFQEFGRIDRFTGEHSHYWLLKAI